MWQRWGTGVTSQLALAGCGKLRVWEQWSWCVGRLLRMGCDPFLMSVCGSVGDEETLWEQNGLPWEHSAENQWEGGEAETESSVLYGGGREKAETENLIMWVVMLELLAGGW